MEYTYKQTDLFWNYLRSLAGLAICAAPFIWLEPAIYIIVVLVAMAVVFAVLLWQTLMRQIARVKLDQDGVVVTDWRTRRIDWSQLRTLQLAYYEPWNLRKPNITRDAAATGFTPQELGRASGSGGYRTFGTSTMHDQAPSYIKDDRSGFMELKLQGGGETLRIGSSLSGFYEIVKAASRAASRNRLNFKAATIANLVAIGIADPRDEPEDAGED